MRTTGAKERGTEEEGLAVDGVVIGSTRTQLPVLLSMEKCFLEGMLINRPLGGRGVDYFRNYNACSEPHGPSDPGPVPAATDNFIPRMHSPD